MQFDGDTGAPRQLRGMQNYMQAKAGAYLLSQEFARRQSGRGPRRDENGVESRNPHGVVHVALNPDFVKTELQRHAPPPMRGVMSAVSRAQSMGPTLSFMPGSRLM